jgi:hypothetical protein
MYLFGGKFCKYMDEELGERECTCPEIISKHPLCECDRKHFNNFLWATVTVFQVSLVAAPETLFSLHVLARICCFLPVFTLTYPFQKNPQKKRIYKR